MFTHFSLDLTVAMTVIDRRNPVEGEWWPIARLGEAGLPTLFDKAARLAMERRMTMLATC